MRYPLFTAALLMLTAPAFAQESDSLVTETDAPSGAQEGFESRFRWGIGVGGGPMVGGYSGFGIGLDARFGMQLSPMLGVYGQPALIAAVGAQADYDNAEVTAAALYGVGALADLTLADHFYLAAGPQLLMGAVGSSGVVVNPDGTTATIEASTGPFFGLAGRAGVVLGSASAQSRGGFALGLDMHIIFAGDALILPMVFLGYESY